MNVDTCAACGGRHTARQRCPNDAPPVEANAFARVEFEAYASAGVPVDDLTPRERSKALRRTASVIGAAIGTVVLITTISVAATFIGHLVAIDADVNADLRAISIAVCVGAMFGIGLLWASARAYAKLVLAFLAWLLVVNGVLMLIFAPVVRQDAQDIAHHRAFVTLLGFGALSLLCGVLIAAAYVWRASRPEARPTVARWARRLGIAYGVLLIASGVTSLVLLILLLRASSSATSMSYRAIERTPFAAWALIPGLLLLYHARFGKRHASRPPWRPPAVGIAFAAYAMVLLCGGLNMAAVHPLAAPMPIVHVLAAALPGLALIAVAGDRALVGGYGGATLTRRQVILAAAITMTLSVAIAGQVEAIGSAAVVVLMLAHNGAFEFARNAADLGDVIGHSDVLLGSRQQFLANLFVASLLAPLIEESMKGFAARLMMGPATTRAQAFMLGATAGAAFGFLEAMLYGAGAVQSSGPGVWWTIMLVRGGSTTGHVLDTGLVALAWWYASFAHESRRAWLLGGLAVANHALWNGFAVTLYSRILGLDTLSDHTITLIASTVVAVMSIGYLVAIRFIATRIRDREEPGAADDRPGAETVLVPADDMTGSRPAIVSATAIGMLPPQ